MTNLWHAFIQRFFPGSVEEYYATREMRRQHLRIYGRQANYIIDCIFFLAPLLIFAFCSVASWARPFLILLSVWGVACVKDAIEEHYCLLLLRRESLPGSH
jgi:hypothetical protein